MGLENIQNYMIGIVLFMVMITGSVYILGQYAILDDTLDPTDMIGNYSKTLNKSTEVTLAVNNIKAGLTKETESGAIGWLDTLVGTAYNTLKAIGGMLSFMTEALYGTANLLGIPTFIITLIGLIAIIVIIFAIWSAIMRV